MSRPSEVFAIALPGAPLAVRFDEGGWLLGTVTGDLTSAELAEMAKHDLDLSARNWALHQLASSADSTAVATRRFIVLNEDEPWLRQTALTQLAHDAATASLAVVRSALRDPDSNVRSEALAALAERDRANAATVARAMYADDPSEAVRKRALGVLARAEGDNAVPTLIEAAAPGRALTRRLAAIEALRQVHSRTASDGRGGVRGPTADALERLTASSEPRGLRVAALDALAAIDPSRVVRLAPRLLGDGDPLFAVATVEALGRIGGATVKERLRAAWKTETRVTVRAGIVRALRGG